MSDKTVKKIIWLLSGIIVILVLFASIYCGITTCDFNYGLSILLKSIATVLFTIATMQVLLIPYYVYEICNDIEDVNSKIDCVITMLHNLKNHAK